MAKVTVNNAALEVIEKGNGEPLVLVHGSVSDYRTTLGQVEVFSSAFRTITYSRRYHWPNQPIDEHTDYSMTEQVSDLDALLDALGAAPAHLVGLSYGAILCLLLAMRKPHRVRTLVLAEPPAYTLFTSTRPTISEMIGLVLTRPRTARALLVFGAKGIGPATKAARDGDMERAIRIFGTAVLGPDFFRRLSVQRLNQVHANAIKSEFVGAGYVPLPSQDVRRIGVPVLLVAGKKSPPLFHRVVERLQELLPDSEMVEVSDASHIIHEDNPSSFNEAVMDFLRRYNGPQREAEAIDSNLTSR